MSPLAKSAVFITAPLSFLSLGLLGEYSMTWGGWSWLFKGLMLYAGWLFLMGSLLVGEKFFKWLDEKFK